MVKALSMWITATATSHSLQRCGGVGAGFDNMNAAAQEHMALL